MFYLLQVYALVIGMMLLPVGSAYALASLAKRVAFAVRRARGTSKSRSSGALPIVS